MKEERMPVNLELKKWLEEQKYQSEQRMEEMVKKGTEGQIETICNIENTRGSDVNPVVPDHLKHLCMDVADDISTDH